MLTYSFPRILCSCFFWCVLVFAGPSANVVQAQNSSVAPMIRLMESGRLPESRLPTVVSLICKRGDAVDLQTLFAKALDPQTANAVRIEILKSLAQTTQDRKLKPAGDLTQLAELLKTAREQQNQELQQLAIDLCGLWQVEEMASDLKATLKTDISRKLMVSIIETLARLGGKESVETIQGLTSKEYAEAVRTQAIASLATLDLEKGAAGAIQYLETATLESDVNGVIQPFLAYPKGPEVLGTTVEKAEISPDIAKLALRAMLTAGRNDAELSDPLSAKAGLDTKMAPLTSEELAALTQEVAAEGDAARGELVFRREELNCYKCHAIGKAGGNIGPDLSAVGGSSPIDYLTNSLLFPSQAIKEAYKTMLIVDIDGLQHTGIVVDADDDRIILKDAQGKEKTIPVDDIEFEKEGDSLMPAGLTKFLTHQEFVDLVRYIAALGKDPEYTMSAEPTVYRWRIYPRPNPKATGDQADDDSIRNQLFEYAPEKWEPFYSYASGDVPIDAARKISRNEKIFLFAEVDANVAGNVAVKLPASDGVLFWRDNERIPTTELDQLQLTKGRHRLMFRIDSQTYPEENFRVVVTKAKKSPAEFSLVVGQ